MIFKRFFPIITLILILSLFLPAGKRKPPLPLEELQNPKSPSYVPIPYPKTREEIITDVKYILKNLFSPTKAELRKRGRKYKSKGTVLMIDSFTKKIRKVKVGKILKVKANAKYFPEDYAFLVEIIDISGEIAAKICIQASGIWAQTRFFDDKNRGMPYKTEEEIKDIFFKKLPDDLKELRINHVEPTIYSYNSDFGSYIRPVWEIKANTDTFYLVTQEFKLFKLKKKLSTEKLLPFSKYPRGGVVIKEFVEKYNCKFHLEDNANDVILGLKEITKEKK